MKAWQLAFAGLVLKKYIYKLIDKFMISATYYINDWLYGWMT